MSKSEDLRDVSHHAIANDMEAGDSLPPVAAL